MININQSISEEEEVKESSIDQKRDGKRLSLLLNDEVNNADFLGGDNPSKE